jgi:transcriptional regulator with XRE-family HTH domain
MMVTQAMMEVHGRKKLRRLCRQRAWLIGDLARESSVHRNVISKQENGKSGAYPETLGKLAKALDADPTEYLEAE